MKACLKLLEGQGGRVIMFSTNMCNKGVGNLKSRNNQKEYGSDNERNMFAHTKEHDFFNKLGTKALRENVTFDLFIGVPHSSESIDLASLNKVV